MNSTFVRRYFRFPVRRMRYRLRRAQFRLRYGAQPAPVLFANSFPKSGTHLLLQALMGFAKLGPAVYSGLPAITMFHGFTGEQAPAAEVARQIEGLASGDIGYGHVHAEPELVDALSKDKIVSYFIYRDPRDVVVSHAYYVTHIWTSHVHHEYYANELTNFEQRLTASIQGRPELTDISFPGIQQRFAPYVGWLDHPATLAIRFEDFIREKQATLEAILEHAQGRGFPVQGDRAQALQLLEWAIDPENSPTFRSGKIGGWREQFTPEHKAVFKELAGELLVKLGYEADLNW